MKKKPGFKKRKLSGATLSDGNITALDNDQSQLDRLAVKLREKGLDDRVKILNKSIIDMNFPDESFDIIWAEGSIFAIGFKNGLKRWRDFIKPGGFLVVHDEMEDVAKKLKQAADCGYNLIEHFTLSIEVWGAEYFEPLEREIQEFATKHQGNSEILAVLDNSRQAIEMYKKKPERCSSVYFILQKGRI